MIIINQTKQEKIYQIPKMPNVQHRKSKIMWLKRQKMLASISSIKSVSVQVKDIKQMIYSKNTYLVSLYAKFHLINSRSSYNDNDYITISKSSDLNKSLIFALISTDWLLDAGYIEKKSIEEIQQECLDLQGKIHELYERRKQIINHEGIDFKIKLFEYKLSCLSEFTLDKVDSKEKLGQSAIGRVLLKEKIVN